MNLPEATKLYETIVVTRHKNLLAYLISVGLVEESTPWFAYANEETIFGKHVIGTLPLRLSKYAAYYTEIPLRVPYEKKGLELELEDIRYYVQAPQTYVIKEIT